MKYDRSQLVFLDTETTGLYPWMGHEVWNIGYIRWSPDMERWTKRDLYIHPQRLDLADPQALAVNRFHERTNKTIHPKLEWLNPRSVAPSIAAHLDGKHVVGACTWFDIEMLRKFFMENDCPPPTCHYHLIDVEALALGWIAAQGPEEPFDSNERELPIPWKSAWVYEQLEIEKQPDAEAHTALGDAEMVQKVWERIMGTGDAKPQTNP